MADAGTCVVLPVDREEVRSPDRGVTADHHGVWPREAHGHCGVPEVQAWPGARARQRARRLDAGRQRRQPLKLRGSPHRRRSFQGPVHVTSGIIEDVTVGLEQLARTAYEAHRGANPDAIPPWEDSSEQEQQAWKAAVSAVAGQTGVTLADAVPAQSLVLQAGDQQHTFLTSFTAGRQGTLVISDDFASTHHARFRAAHGLWYVEDLGSKNGTWLNGRRIHAAQRLKKGDKLKIGHTVVTVVTT